MFGYGVVNVGNFFCELIDDDVWVVLDVVWESGICFYDMVLYYGFGFFEC